MEQRKLAYHRDTCIPISTAALFTITKLWNALQLLNRLGKCGIYTQWILIAIKKNEIMSFCRSVDGTREHHVKWSKPGSERKRLHVFSHMRKTEPKINIYTDKKWALHFLLERKPSLEVSSRLPLFDTPLSPWLHEHSVSKRGNHIRLEEAASDVCLSCSA
jgi:hypothetical protein